MNKVVLTGAKGFIGSHVLEKLTDHKVDVLGVGREIGDLKTPNLPRGEVLVHCAGVTPSKSLHPETLYEDNMELDRSVFSQLQGYRAVIYLSSVSAYGRVEVPVLTEDTPPIDPNPYGRAKLDAESLLKETVSKGLMSAISIRLPGVVGRGCRDIFLSKSLDKVKAGEVVKVRNPESLFNNMVFVKDLAWFVGQWQSNPKPGYSVINLGSSEPLPMKEVVGLLFDYSKIERKMEFEDSGHSFTLSIKLAMKYGFKPSNVRAGLESFVRSNK